MLAVINPVCRSKVIYYKEHAMKFSRRVATMVTLIFSTLMLNAIAYAGECDFCVCKGADTVNSCIKCCSPTQKIQSTITELELQMSDDGTAIVDQNGAELARIVKGTRVQITKKGVKTGSQKMQGCWKCYYVCIIWDGDQCVENMRTCDWDFDCK